VRSQVPPSVRAQEGHGAIEQISATAAVQIEEGDDAWGPCTSDWRKRCRGGILGNTGIWLPLYGPKGIIYVENGMVSELEQIVMVRFQTGKINGISSKSHICNGESN
jgi:hypothetical protein